MIQYFYCTYKHINNYITMLDISWKIFELSVPARHPQRLGLSSQLLKGDSVLFKQIDDIHHIAQGLAFPPIAAFSPRTSTGANDTQSSAQKINTIPARLGKSTVLIPFLCATLHDKRTSSASNAPALVNWLAIIE
eukprot:498364_1